MQAILDAFVANARRENLYITYAQIRRDGDVAASWQRFTALSRQESHSASKGFVAAGVGIAIDDGLLSLHEKIADFFPELTEGLTDPNILDITIQDLLTMTTGLAKPMFFRDSEERATVHDWARHFYEQGWFVRPPGHTFLYNNINTYLLGRAVGIRYGKNLHEYMRQRLFEPLGIGNPDMTICPQGHTIGANGMAINVDEMARFGQMVLQNGEFNGKRIVSARFIKDAVKIHVSTHKHLPVKEEEGTLGYGYHFWVDPSRNIPFLWGVYGQYCAIVPEKNAVVTVQSLEENDAAVGRRVWLDIIDRL